MKTFYENTIYQVNLKHGVNRGTNNSITCTACIGTYIVEFGTLSRLTGKKIYEDVAIKALKSLWNQRSKLGLFGSYIKIIEKKWKIQTSNTGGGNTVHKYFFIA